MAEILNAIKNDLVGSPDPRIRADSQQVAQELGLAQPVVVPVPTPLDPASVDMQSNDRNAVASAGVATNYLNGNVGGPLDVAASMDKNQVPYALAPDQTGQPQVVPVAAQQQAAQKTQADQNDFATPPKAAQVSQIPTMQNVQLPDEAKAYLAETGKQQAANNAIATAEADKATADAAAFKNARLQVAQTQSQLKKLHDDFENKFSSRMTEMDGISKQLANQDFTSPKIDEGNFWATRSTPQSIMAGIAIALGAVGGGFSGTGKNSAVDVINKAIDRDIEVQKFNAQKDMQEKQLKSQNLRDQLGAQSSMLSNLRAKYGDEVQAQLAYKSLALEATQQQLNLNAAKSQSPIVQQRAALLNSQLEQQKQQATMQLKQQMIQQAYRQQLLGDGDPTKVPSAALAALSPEDRKIVEERRERWVPGWGEALTKEGATKFREQTAETRTALNNIDEIVKASKDLHALSPLTDREKVAEIRTRLNSLIGNLNKSLNKTNRLSDVDVHLVTDTLGDPTANTSLKSIQLKKLGAVKKILMDDVNNIAESNGIQKQNFTNFDKDTLTFPKRPLK